MTTQRLLTLLLSLLFVTALAGCPTGDDDDSAATDDDDAVDDDDTVDDDDSGDDDDSAAADAFVFATDLPSAYTRVDRAGMPAINTAVISSKDAYNAGNPADDAAGTFAPEILVSLDFLHTALDDDLTAAGLTPCTVVGDGSGSCAVAAVPLVIPDTLKFDTTTAAGFPNGRLLADPVIDVTLAVVLLELVDGTHTATDLVGLNPVANDVAFPGAFPYLAAPH